MKTNKKGQGYPSDVSDEEWDFVKPYLCLVREQSPQRRHDLRLVFNAVRYVARSGCSWRMLPHDFPQWELVYQQSQEVDQGAGVRDNGQRPARVVAPVGWTRTCAQCGHRGFAHAYLDL